MGKKFFFPIYPLPHHFFPSCIPDSRDSDNPVNVCNIRSAIVKPKILNFFENLLLQIAENVCNHIDEKILFSIHSWDLVISINIL